MKRKGVLALLIFLFIVNASYGIDYFWVGGNGNWSDFPTHWATSSGGSSFHVQIPTSADNVYFDANSFTGNTQTVNIDVPAVCSSMNWTGSDGVYSGAVNGPSLSGTQPLEIFGSFILAANMRPLACTSLMRLLSNLSGNIIDPKGVLIQSYNGTPLFSIEGAGEWTFTSALNTNGSIYLTSGTLNFGNNIISMGYFVSESGQPRVLNLNSATINLVGPGRYAWANFGWQVTPAGLTLNAGTSTINIALNPALIPIYVGWIDFDQSHFYFFGGSQRYYNITTAAGTYVTLVDNNTIENLTFNDKGDISGSNTILNSMTLKKGYEYSFTGGSTQNFSSGSTSAISIPNASFETPYTSNYTYSPTGGSWIFSGGSGVLANTSAFQNAAPVDGSQVCFIQGDGGSKVAQPISFPAGNYQISFYGAQRTSWNTTNQVIKVWVGASLIDVITPVGGAFAKYTTATFNIPAPITDTLRFEGITPGDNTAFIDKVEIIDLAYTPPPPAVLNAIGDCGSLINIKSYSLTASAAFQASSWTGSVIDYSILFNINFLTPITADHSVDQAGNTGITFNSLGTSNLFWVGGTGDWNDGNHWSLSSGGAPSGCIPTPQTNVYFDGNSFSGAGQKVSINALSAYCKDMDWTGAGNSPEFTSGNLLNSSLNIHGSLKFISAMTLSLKKPTNFWGNGVHTVTSAGQTFKFPVTFQGTGVYTLNDAFEIVGITTEPNTGYLYLHGGTLNTNDQMVTAKDFESSYVGLPRTLNMGASIFNIKDDNMDGRTSWNVTSTFMTLNAGTSTINLSLDNYNFTGGWGLTYYNVNFIETYDYFTPRLTDGNVTFHDLTFQGNGTFLENNNTITGSLNLKAGKSYVIAGGYTVNFTAGAVLNAIGTCQNYIEIKSSSTTQANFSKPSGTINISYIILQNINATGGATFNAASAVDNGGNSGWNLITSPGRTLYWVGNGGNWNDPAHWSLTSGGAPGVCPPTLQDDVFFNGNSFSSTGQSVVVNMTQAFCKNMDWSGATNSPAFSSPNTNLNIYGSMTLIPAMSIDHLFSVISFKGTGANTITTAGHTLNGANIYFDAHAGSYDLLDDFKTALPNSYDFMRGKVYLQSGTLNTNGHDLLWSSLSTNTTDSKTLNLSSSTLTITGFYQCCNSYMWDMRGSGLTFNAGTSTIYWPMAAYYDTPIIYGGDQVYNKVIYQYYLEPDHTTPMQLYGNNTFKSLELNNEISVLGNNTITDNFTLGEGHKYTFGDGTTQTFGASAHVQVVGTGGSNVTIQTQTIGVHASWVKSAGKVCTDFVYLRDIDVSGGARWRGGANADPQPGLILDPGVGINGWDLSAYPIEGTGVLSGGEVLCPGGSTTISIALTGSFPKYVTYTDGGVNYLDTANASPYTVTVTPGTTTTYSIVSVEMDVCISNATPPSGSALVQVLNGTAGMWTGLIDTNWFLCKNWASGHIPTSATDVEIPAGVSKMPLIGSPGALCHDLNIDPGASLSMPAASASLQVYGDFIDNGTFTQGLGTVEFKGASMSDISGLMLPSIGAISDPSATITARGEYAAGYEKEKAFDNNPATKWADLVSPSWIQIQYSGGTKYLINQYSFTSPADSPERDPLNWTLSASNDGIAWTQIDSRSNETFATRGLKRTFSFVNGTAYSYYKFDLANSVATIMQIGDIEFNGAPYSGPGTINFYNLIQSNTSSLHLSSDIGVQGVLTINDGYIDLNAHTVSVTNSATTAIIRNAGYIKSENTSNLSNVAWQIGSTAGAHIFPFGKNGSTYIPFTVNLTAGDIGNLTVSTYPTAINNTLYPSTPQQVTNLLNKYNADNSLFTVDRFWQLTKTGAAATTTLTFSYAQEEVDGQNITESLLKAQRYEKTTDRWQDSDSSGLNGSVVTHSNNSVTNTVTVAGVKKFSPWTLASDDSPLPVDFISVEAREISDGQVAIAWKTAKEQNCDYYQVQRSVDASTFAKVGETVKATNKSNYEVVDDNPFSGTNYYRVQMVEYGGNMVYSPVRNVNIEGLEEFNIFPNPASTDNFNVSLKDGIVNEEVLVVLYNSLGQEMYSKVLINKEGNMITAINLEGSISPGVYLVVGSTNYAIFKKKILIK